MSTFPSITEFLAAFDAHESTAKTAQASSRAGTLQFLEAFKEKQTNVIEPVMRDIAILVKAAGHAAKLVPVSVERPDPSSPPYPSLTFCFWPRNGTDRRQDDQTPALKIEAEPKSGLVRVITTKDNPKAAFFESLVVSKTYPLNHITADFIEQELCAVLQSTVGGPAES